ncbi:MAG: DUF5916 domain-containing protein [Hyalangium sp.]|uniref:DUF5916 domain-containing protein n=1 Tax=Hyalangium sp. TaxID=2028555 RepID=UPI00389A392D
MILPTLLIASFINAAGTLQPPRIAEDTAQIQIDGGLDEPAWASAADVSEFAVVVPDSGSKPLYQTHAKIFYTEKGIYVGVWSEQPFDQQVLRLSPHDVWLEGDFIQIGIDPTGTGRYGYMFGIFLGGSAADSTLLPERRYNWNWDGPWRRATKSLPDGWSAEAFLPWSMFAMPRSEGKSRLIGLYLARWVSALNERWSWPALPLTRPRFLSAFQPMVVEDVEPRPNIALYPYTAPRYDQVGMKPGFRAGIDAFWNPTAQTRFAATILPDFGQVDTDELVVNLSAFETFFPEKRPFFTEGQDIFQTGRVNAVYTRRIGAAPDAPTLPDGAQAEGLPGASEILGAAKIAGQAGNVQYGLMGAADSGADYTVRLGDEITNARIKGRKFGAGRLLFESQGGGYRAIGLLGTIVQTPLAAAVVSAVDGHFHTEDGRWQTDGQGIFGWRAGQRDYGAWLETTLTPTAGDVHALAIEHYGANLQLNDFGFLRRNALSQFEYHYTRTRALDGLLKEIRTEFLTQHGWNTHQQLVDTLFQGLQELTFRGNTVIDVQVGYLPRHWDDRNSRGNGAFRVAARPDARIEAWSDKSKQWILGVVAEGHGEDLGGFSESVNLVLKLNPSGHFSMETQVALDRLDGWLVWQREQTFATYNGFQITPRLDVSALFSPRQQLKLSVQWLGLRAEPRSNWEIGGDGRLFQALDSPPAPEIFKGTLALQIRYRYEFAPLSDLFLVYSRGGDATADGPYGFLARDSFRYSTISLFMMKVRYRFDL